MNKFSKEFYSSRIDDWITKYVKVKELCKLIKSIQKDIEKNRGEIIRENTRNPSISFEEIQRNTITVPLDRHSVGLDVLEDTEGLFNKDAKIFNTPLMYEINELFGELDNLEYGDDIKIFLYFLTIEVHNVYVFYTSIEKNIFMRVNEHSNTRKKYREMNDNELLEELIDLTDITYLLYSFYSYIDLNIKAVQEVLKYFDEHFQLLNHNISIKDLYIKKYLAKKDSDLRYILSFKIIIDSCVIIESYYHEIVSLSHTKEIKEQKRELKEVLSFLNEKNTDRVNDDIHEVYLKQKNIHFNNIIKQKKNLKIDIQNSFCVDVHQQEDLYKRLGEKQFDEEINIKISKKNIYNLIILYFHTFVYSFYYIMPYLVFYFYFINNKIHIYYLGFVLTATHLGNVISKIIINLVSEKFKIKFIIFCICFIISFVLGIYSERYLQEEAEIDELKFFAFNLISRFFYGFSCGRLLTRQYIMQYLPESEIKFFSVTYLVVIYLGGLVGIILNFLLKDMKPLYFEEIAFYLEGYYFIFFIGAIIYVLYLILIVFVFTEPNQATMLEQSREKSIQKMEEEFNNEIHIEEKNISDYKELYDENESGNDSNKLGNLLFRDSSFGIKRNTTNKGLDIVEEETNEDINKTFNEKISRRLTENILNTKDNNHLIELTKKEGGKEEKDEDETLSTPLNISSIKNKDSKNSTNLDSNNYNKISKDTTSNEILSAEEMKGLNSIEKELINLNAQNNFDDINLMPNELERIMKSNYKNNRSYLCSFLVFIITLLLTTSLNEFTLLSSPIIFLSVNNIKSLILEEKNVIIIIIVLHIFSFPFIIFTRMIRSFNVERRILLIFYLILCGLLIISSTLIYFISDYNSNSIYSIFGIVLIYIANNLIEGATHLLSNKLIPSFVKICDINNKYLISYSTVFGKIIGGLIFCDIYYLMEKDIINEEKVNKDNINAEFINLQKTKFFKINVFIFSILTIISFFAFILSYKKLRVRAISKLFYISD